MRSRALRGLILLLVIAVPAVAQGAQGSDAGIGDRVSESIRQYPKFSIFDDVDAVVTGGTVKLVGRVTTEQKKDEIGARVAHLDGVKSVANEIGVLPVSQADQRLRVAAANAIYNHPAFWRYAELPNPPIHIIVEHQRITLTGEVDSPVDRMLAYSLAQVGGALSVTNQLRIGR